MAWKLSRHCKQIYSYGICERCDKCGCVTRREMYDELKDTAKKLYDSSKKCDEQMVNLKKDIEELNSVCEKISQELTKYNVLDNDMIKLSKKVRKLSKVLKLLHKIMKKPFKQIEETSEFSKIINNRIDFK